RAQRPAGAHPPGRGARVDIRGVGGGRAWLGGVRSAPLLAGLLPVGGRRRAQPRAAGRPQRVRRGIPVTCGARWTLCPAAGGGTDVHHRGGRPPHVGCAPTCVPNVADLTPTCDSFRVTLGRWVTLGQKAVENTRFCPRVPLARREWSAGSSCIGWGLVTSTSPVASARRISTSSTPMCGRSVTPTSRRRDT